MTEAEDLLQELRDAFRTQYQIEATFLGHVAEIARIMPHDEVVAMVEEQGRMPHQMARDLFDLSIALTTTMSVTFAAMRAGEVGHDKAMEIFEVVRHLSGDAALAKESELLNQRSG